MRPKPILRHVLAAAIALLCAADASARCSGCGCRGGPGYRAPDGKCASWKDIQRKCGTPPETKCTDERKKDGKVEATDEDEQGKE